jgi:hypothetical protein
MVAGSDDVNIQLKQFLGQRRSNAETSRRIFSVRDHQVDGLISDNARQSVFDDGPPGPSENVADEKNPHGSAGVAPAFRNRSVKVDGNTRIQAGY